MLENLKNGETQILECNKKPKMIRRRENKIVDNHGEILIYQTEGGLTKIDVNMQDETYYISIGFKISMAPLLWCQLC